MKPNNVIIVLIAVLILGGIVLFFGKNQKTKSDNTIKTEKPINNVFTSIKDAMMKSLSLKCEYKTPASTVITYIKGKSIRIDGTTKENKTSTIIKNDKMWTWDEVKKEGIIMSLKQDENSEKSESDKTIENLEKQKEYCKTAVVSDSMFNPPTDIKFNDLSKMIEGFQNVK